MPDQNPEIKVKLTAEDTGVSAAIRQLGQELKNLKKNEQEASEGAISLSKAFEGIVAIAGLLKLEEIGKEAFNAAVDIGKMSDKLGISTEQLSVFHHVAEETGVETGAVDKALIKAAKSITEFEQGSSKAAKGFALLNIHQKDFVGLKADQKIALVTERLGHMQKGLEKTTAAQLIFSKGGAEFIPVANAIAAEGYDKITDSVRKLGLLLSQSDTDAFRATKASMQELKDLGKGVTTQFELGLLPAVADVAEGFVEAVTGADKGVESFKHLGEIAGTALRSMVFGLGSVGIQAGHSFAVLEEAADFAFNRITEAAKSSFASTQSYIRFGVIATISGITAATQDAATQLAEQLATTAGGKGAQAGSNDFVARIAAIEADNVKAQQALYDKLFPSDEEEARRNKERIARLRTDKTTAPGGIPDDSKARDAARDDLRRQAELDRIAKAEEALLVRQLQDEIAIWKAYEKQRETVEKNSFEDGRLTTEEYYRRRQADLKTETEKEIQILRAELKAAEDEITRSAEQRDSNTAKAGQFRGRAQREGPTTEGGKQATSIARDYEGEASKNEASRLAALARFNELQTKINTTTIEGKTKSIALDTEGHKATDEDHKKVLEFEAQLAELQGKRIERSIAEIEAQADEKRQALEKAGTPTDQIDAEIAKWKQLTLAAAEFAKVEDEVQQKEKTFQVDRNSFDIARNTIEAQQRAGLLTKSQAEKKINDLIDARLPLLKQEAAAELAIAQAALRQAQATGNQNDIAKAQEQIAAAQNLSAEIDKLGIKTHQLATTIKGAIASDFQNFFNSLITGSQSAGRAFAQLGINILQSLEQIVAQMLITIALEKIFSALGFAPQTQANTTKQKEVVAANTAEAASTVFVQAIEAIPFPANLAVAPALAAAAEAEMGGLTAGAVAIGGTAAQGAYLPKDMLVQAHAQEMILPEHLSTGLDYAIRTGSFNPPEALSQPVTSNRGGDTYGGDTYHLHHNGEDAKTVLERELVPMIKNARRQNRLRL